MLNLIHAGRRESSHPACLRPFRAAFQFRAATGLMVRSLQDAAVALLVMGNLGLCAQSNPVLSGDHPDPSVIRVGAAYWAANTSDGWGPIFPIFRSRDLWHWQPAGAAFQGRPGWAERDFWAPKLTRDRRQLRVYYAARKRSGPLCVAVATAQKPQGPYDDHGPLVCQPDGSIDPAFFRDQGGKSYLVWKEDGNSVHLPSKIWLQPASEDGLHLSGVPVVLLTNDAPWEGDVVEAPFLLKRGAYFYLFYAGGACCGSHCSYGEGVARAKRLQGPWEKDPANPIIASNGEWKCPGHGTVVHSPAGGDHLMYHAYPQRNPIFVGREAVLDRVIWQANGWPSVNDGGGVGGTALGAIASNTFQEAQLSSTWQWPVEHKPILHLKGGELDLAPEASDTSDPLGAILAQPITSLPLRATVEVAHESGKTLASIALVGNAGNAAGIGVTQGQVVQWRRDQDVWRKTAIAPVIPGRRIFLAIESLGSQHLNTSWSLDGIRWNALGITEFPLPPWDASLRVGITCGGDAGAHATFSNFHPITRK